MKEIELVSGKRKPREANLLYKSDPKNETNFHHYIDGKSDLVMLFKLKNSMIIGGYGNGFFNSEYQGNGIIFNIN